MQPCNITHQIVEAIACNPSCSIQVNSLKALHDFRVVWDIKIRHHRFPKALHLHVLTVILSNGDTGVDDVGDGHHNLHDFLRQFPFLCLQLGQTGGVGAYLGLDRISLLLLTLCHQFSNFLGQLVPAGAQVVCFLLGDAVFCIQCNHFVHQRQFAVLEFIFNVLFDDVRVFSYKLQI